MSTEKKTRSVNAWKVFNQISNYGELLDENKQVNELPPVGSRVVVLEKYVFERSKDTDKVIAVYRTNSSFHDRERISYNNIYRVVQYTKGIDKIYASNNLIVLKNERTGVTQSVKASSVATGSMKLRIVDEDYVEKRDRSFGDTAFSTEVAEYSYLGKKMREEAALETTI